MSARIPEPRRTVSDLVRRLAPGSACLIGLMLLAAGAAAQSAAVPGMIGLIWSALSGVPACAQPRVLGPCFCGPSPCGIRIQQYVPVAVIETTRAPGDSVLMPSGVTPSPLSTASSRLSMTDHTAEVHVWTIPDAALPPGLCLACPPSSARLPSPATEAPVPGCDFLADTLKFLVASPLQSTATAWIPTLVYASEADAVNWRTGCHDLFSSLAWASAACLAGTAGSVNGACLGAWGPLKPRQMRDIGLDPVCFSAKTAVRAMSLARTVEGHFDYPVDTAGRLQQIYPVRSACFDVGQLPLPSASQGLQGTQTSPDGRYAWIYWRLTSCCRDPARMAAQCTGASAAVR